MWPASGCVCAFLLLTVSTFSPTPAQESTSAPTLSSYQGNEDRLRRFLQDAISARSSGNAQQFNSLAHDMLLPNHLEWFNKTFGQLRGPLLDKKYAGLLDHFEERLGIALDQIIKAQSGTLEIRVVKENAESPEAVEAALLQHLKSAQTFYIAEEKIPGEAKPERIGYFVFADNSFRLLDETILGALMSTLRIQVDDKLMRDRLMNKPMPRYPTAALQNRLSGIAVIQILVGTDGAVRQVQVVRGHPMLAPAAADAVRHWMYKPTIVLGEGVEVETSVTIVFSLEGFGINPKVSMYP